MNWLALLAATYDANEEKYVGKMEINRFGAEYTLIPISHTTQMAHIEVRLNGKGKLLGAAIIRDKKERNTIIPCTEASASRTSAPVPHPLFDKLQYVAGDYAHYCGENDSKPYQDYLAQLKAWCDSPYGHDKVRSVYEYIRQGTLIEDLVSKGVLLEEQGRLVGRWNSDSNDESATKMDPIVSDPSAAFVRFVVQIPGDPEGRLWRDLTVQKAFINYYESSLHDLELCFVTGQMLPVADKHASRIRNAGDKSKLISSNDTDGFTFRGRFRDSRDAATVSYQISQKGHNALKWLIEKQGFPVDSKTFVVWGTPALDVLTPFEGMRTDGDPTSKEYANQVRKAIDGHRFDSRDYKSRVAIMALDAATPGRLAIVYYRDLHKEEYLNQIEEWHLTCCWHHHYWEKGELLSYMGSPATREIVSAVYGPDADDKVKKGLMERLLPCITEGRELPKDIVRSAMNRASNPNGMDTQEWEKTFSFTCSLIHKTEGTKGGIGVNLNTEIKDHSYLFGRLLAVADVLESNVLDNEKNKAGQKKRRATNAIRYMNIYVQRPVRTWGIIRGNIQPYLEKLGSDAWYYQKLMDDIGDLFDPLNYKEEALGGLFYLGYSSQRKYLYTSKKAKEALAGQNGDGNQQEQEGVKPE